MREATDGGRYRRYRTAYNEVSRKNGKSTLGAGIGLYLLDADGEPGAEVYSAATVKDQAKIVWREAMQMVRKSPALRRRIQMVGTGPKSQGANMFVPDTASKFEPLGADVDSLDGLNVHGAIVDELHAHKTRSMWDVLETATAARRQPLIWAITTAGFNRDGICYELREYSVQVLEGLVQDDRWFAFIATIDEGDDPFDETIWIKANPNLGISVKLDDLRSLVLKAKQIPAALNNFHVPRQHGGRWQPRLVYVHEGWRDGPDGRRQLVRAQYFGGLEDSQELWSTVWDYLDRHYDLEHVAAIFVAGDGAGWIRKGCEYMPKSVFVLDRYHVHKQLSEALGADPERRRAVWRALDSLNAREVQRLLRKAYQQADSDYRRQAIRRTATYLRRNWDGI